MSVVDPTAIPPPVRYADQGNDAYSQYVKTGQLPAANAGGSMGVPPVVAPVQAPAPAPAPSGGEFDALVKAHEATNGGKPLSEQQLDSLRDSYWATQEPGVWASHKGITKGAVLAEKGAFNAGYNDYKAKYLKTHADPATVAKGGAGEALTDFGKAAGGTLAKSGIELGRDVAGGVVGLGEGIGNAFQHYVLGNKDYDAATDPSNSGLNTDRLFSGIDNGLGARAGEDAVGKMVADATQRSPIAGTAGQIAGVVAPAFIPGGQEVAGDEAAGFIASHLPGAVKAAIGPTLSQQGDARDKGASVAQQYGVAGVGALTNTAMGLVPGAKSVLGRAAVNALVGGGVGAAGQEAQHLIAPNQVDAPTLPDTGKQAGVAAVLGELAHRGGNILARKKPAETVAPAANPVDAAGNPVTNADGSPVQIAPGVELPVNPNAAPVPPDAIPPGPGVPDDVHAVVVKRAESEGNLAKPKKGEVLTAPEVVARAKILASEDDTGTVQPQWVQMTAEQRQTAIEAAASALNKHAKVDGLPEALAADRATALAPAPAVAAEADAVPEGATVPTETGEVPQANSAADLANFGKMGKGIADSFYDGFFNRLQGKAGSTSTFDSEPQFAAAKAAMARGEISTPEDLKAFLNKPAAQIPGMEDGSETPPAAQVGNDVAAAALAGEGANASPIDNTPKTSDARTAAQAQQSGTIDEVQQHADLDAQLKAMKKGLKPKFTKATIDKMTLADKQKVIADAQPKPKANPLAKKGAPSDDVLAATQKADAPGINKINDNGQPRQPGEPLSSKTPIVSTKDVHLAGGVSQDGNTIYIDQRMPKFVVVGGKRINVHEAVALHERVEWPLMKEMGAKYHDAHDAATAAENHFIRQKYGVDPELYQKKLQAAIKKAGIENRHPSADIPADLDTQPNVDLGDTKPLEGKVNPISKRGSPPKKAEAPADAQPAEPVASSESQPSLSDAEKLLAQHLTPSELGLARIELENARSGLSSDEWNARVRELRTDESITAEEAKMLRQAGRKEAPDPTLRDRGNKAEPDVAPSMDAAYSMDEQIAERRTPGNSDEAKAAAAVAREAESFKADRLKSSRAVAKDIIAKMRSAFADSPNHMKAIDLLDWALDKNPALVDRIRVQAKNLGRYTGGTFDFLDRILTVTTDRNIPTDAAVHELLHASEELLPPSIGDKILAARRAEVLAESAKAAPRERAFFSAVQRAINAPPAERQFRTQEAQGQLKLLSESAKAAGDPLPRDRFDHLYSLTDASEYWAVNATQMLQGRAEASGVMGKAAQWLREFISKMKNVLAGNANKNAILDGLNHVLEPGQSEPVAKAYLRRYDDLREQYKGQPAAFSSVGDAEPVARMITQSPAKTITDAHPTTQMDNLVESFANNAKMFLKIDAGLRKALGADYDETTSPYNASVRLPSDRERMRGIDRDEVIAPLDNYFKTDGQWQKFGKTPEEAIDRVGVYLQTKHALDERIPQQFAENVPLNNGREVTRQKIMAEAAAARAPAQAKAAKAKLDALVKANASMPVDAWADSNFGKDFMDGLRRQRQELQGRGINDTTTAPINDMVQKINERARQRLIESGKVASDDMWTQFNGYKHYVPLKGSALDGVADAQTEPMLQADDLSGITRQKNGYVTNLAQLRTAEGRATWASNPLLRTLIDAGNAAGNAADHGFTGNTLDLIRAAKRDPRLADSELSKVVIHRYEGTPRGGYDNLTTGAHIDNLNGHKNALVHNDGRFHYVMEFPEGSQYYRGLQAINTNFDPREFPMLKPVIDASEHLINKGVQAVSKLTGKPIARQEKLITRANQFVGKAYTIANPIWQITTLLPRSMMEKPLMMAVRNGGVIDGAQLLAKTYANILSGALKGGKAWGLLLRHDAAGLRAEAKANPGSMADWWNRYQEGGGGNTFSQGFTMDESKNLFVQGIKQAEANPLSKGVHAYVKYMGGLSDAIENMSSLGIFKTFVEEHGLDDRTAAARTKDLLNYQQTGTAGKALNGYHNYFRVIMTQNESTLRAFQHTDGPHTYSFGGKSFQSSFDWGKIGQWGLVMGGYSMAKYFFDRQMMGEDENGKSVLAKIAKVNAFDLVQKSFIPGTGSDGHPVAVPMGLGLAQILTAGGTLAAAVTAGDIAPDEAAKAYGEMLQRNVSFIEPTATPEGSSIPQKAFAYANGMILPSIAQPGAALSANANVFGQPIHTAYPDDKKFVSDQGKRTTPKMWKDLAGDLREHTGIDFYPETLPFVVTNYGGSTVTDLLRLTLASQPRTDQGLPDNALTATTRLTNSDADYYDSARMYKTLDSLLDTKKQLSSIQQHAGEQAGAVGSDAYKAAAQQAGNEWISSNPQAAKELTAYNQLDAARKTFQSGVKALATSNYTPEGKRNARKLLDSQLRQATDAAEKALE